MGFDGREPGDMPVLDEVEQMRKELAAEREESSRVFENWSNQHAETLARAVKAEYERDALRGELGAEYDRGRASRDAVVAAGHLLFVYAQKAAHKIERHSLGTIIPQPDTELMAWIRAVAESSKSERARIDAAMAKGSSNAKD